MTIPQFEQISLTLGITGLIAYMFFIVYDLAKKSDAGRIGTFALFFALGLGMFGFAAKTVIQIVLEV